MASNFPSSLDSFTNPSSSDAMDSVSVPHATQHSDLNDAVEALQAKVGANSSAVATSLDYKVAQLETDPRGLVSYAVAITGSGSLSAGGEDTILVSASFTPVAGRKYKISYNIGMVNKTGGNGNIYLTLRLGNSSAGTLLDQYWTSSYTNVFSQERGRGKFGVFTTSELGTSATTVCMGVYTNSTGADYASGSNRQSFLLVEDIGT